MGDRNAIISFVLAEPGEPVITQLPGSHLDAHGMRGRVLFRIEIRLMERHSGILGPLPYQ